MNQPLLDASLRDVLRALSRYRPFIGTVLAVLLIVAFLPGKPKDTETPEATGSRTAFSGQPTTSGQTAEQVTTASEGAAASGPSAGPAAGAGQAARQAAGQAKQAVAPAVRAVVAGQDPLSAADCDRVTGRIRVPTKHAPPCVPDWPKGTDNGGATSKGVSATEIIVANRQCDTPQGQAVNAALGIDDTPEDGRVTNDAYADLFNAHYQTYGRKVKLVHFQCSGDSDEAAKADAIKVATEIKAFATLGGPGVYIDELAARGVLCVSIGCYASAAIEQYLRNKPHVWGWYITNTQAYMHRMEYIGKRLCGRPARWAGDPTYKALRRKFAVLSFNDAQNAYKAGAEFGVKEIEKYQGADGGPCKADDLIFQTLDVQKAQEDARVIISRLKEKGITSVLYTGDPISLIFISKEATNQQYFPEWLIGASVLTDTTFFGRLYDQQQWRNAFGISWNPARVPRDLSDAWRLHVWHHGQPPRSEDTYSVIYPNHLMLFTGIHLAGSKLTPQTFRDGLFSYPPTPAAAAGITVLTMSFGNHGLWPWEDYTSQDDATEIWWDPSAAGQDENGNSGIGMVRYVDGGKRYMPGQRPTTEPKAFDPAGTVMVYDTRPAQDEVEAYEHKHFR